ncbi:MULTISPECIES: hypothetical protein [unclassified Mesorhizobium]|uniref:hypothetical protein n=1 Tax=unclassified Mesorhizobium TaxID=325217 RepID=UPI000F758F2A|nr:MULTISPECIES: hypothetical protein [unclassified Mesorhizobium]RUW73382.1 hypothetical protein EOA28_18835 [Mesorhizobium sp. M2A.F.Ca.ET.067.02.1.1]AZO02014.1 hypothetical protein EJ068_02230 [Mesorhizobium sp. M2A.F.Ca.ET.043.02.1.1]RUW39085.1 hypothetical protein EOA37_21450 [Mesorhizobium sp. M2A.F.Ca.ET.015.02.1.1]RVC96031.1 hypothetical protein EN739_10535 [Mesorhizobium sp. M2A.F.Ca.ET.017.03.2.1]RVD11950.1 hypothetical protein EN753_00050 [Mesorhizobium sp. M2A.F.Ca.ET.029.05.1.1]
MGKHFSDEQIDEFLDAYLARFPDAIERMEYVMLHPFDENDELMSRNFREMQQVAQTMEFFVAACAKHGPTAIHHLIRDVANRVSAGLSPRNHPF